MLDPHVRLGLTPEGNGTFAVQFKVPDVYGVFKYVLDYRHMGYSYVFLTEQVGESYSMLARVVVSGCVMS